jgi:hypothetical protein
MNRLKLMKMAKLISSVDQLAENVRRYNEDPEKFADLMPYNRAWYALRTTNAWLFGPSKFVGYDISPEEYLRSPYSAERHGRIQRDKTAPPLDGRVTEGVLKRWSYLVEQGHPDYDSLHTALNELCARYGKKPNTLARISLIRTAPQLESDPNGDDLVALLAAVFRGLTPAQKSVFRRMATKANPN